MMNNQLTREQLLEAVEDYRPDDPVSQSQLKRWVKAGLLPPPKAGKSRGRGQGIPQYWDSACIDRIKIIVASIREQKPNLNEAGRRLFAQGFALRGDVIRGYLEEIPERLEINLNRQRPFMRGGLSPASKATRLKESVKRKHVKDQPQASETPSDWIDALAEMVVGATNLSGSENVYQQLGHFLNPSELRTTFQKVNDDNLETLFLKTLNEFGSLGFATRSITNMLREHGWGCAIDPILPTQPSTERYKTIFEFRRSALLWGVLLSVHGNRFATVLQNVIGQQLGNLFTNMVSLENLEKTDDLSDMPPMP